MPRARLLVWSVGMLLGIAAEAVAWSWDEPGLWLPDLAVGVTLLSCGLLAARLRPTGWSASLLTAAGLAWFVPNFSTVEPALVAQLAAALLFVHRGPLLHAILAYPDGRTASLSMRCAIALSYLAAVGQAFWPGSGLGVAVACMVLGVAVARYVSALRSQRHARLFALMAAATWAIGICGTAVARSVLSAGSVNAELLVTYESLVVVVAAILTVGLRSTWSDRTLMTDLVVELGTGPTTAGLERELATVLGDPDLQVGYWVAEEGIYVNIDGHPLHPSIDGDKRSVTPVDRDGARAAVLVHDPTVLSDPALLDAVSAAVRLVAVNARLRAEVLRRVADVTASRRRILEATDEQRRRLESRVRQGPLNALAELDSVLGGALRTADGEESRLRVEAARRQLTLTRNDLHQLAQGMHPHGLAQRGLAAALADLSSHSPVPIEVEGSVGSAPAAVQAAAYFICSEAFANAVKHSSASRVAIALRSEPGLLVIDVSDDGVGGAEPSHGSGLQGLKDRVEALGGTLTMLSPPGGGTQLMASLPTSPRPEAS